MIKLVNGKPVQMTPAEIAELEAGYREPQLSAREVGNQLIDDLTLEWQDLADTYPTAAPELLSIGTSVRQAIDNAVRVAELRQQARNLAFAKSLITDVSTPAGMTQSQADQAKTDLTGLFPS